MDAGGCYVRQAFYVIIQSMKNAFMRKVSGEFWMGDEIDEKLERMAIPVMKHGTIVGCLQEGCIKELYNVNGMYSPLAGTWYIYIGL